MSETLETVLRASVRTLAAAAGLSPSRMHQLGKLTVLQTLPRKAVTSANAAGVPGLRTYLTHDESRHRRVSGPIAPIHEASPGAAEVCRRRGVADVRLGDLNEPPSDLPWAGVVLSCGNLGLGGSWQGNRRLLARLAELALPGAVLVGDSVTPEGPPRVVLRIRYRDLITPWWPQYNIPTDQMAALIKGTG